MKGEPKMKPVTKAVAAKIIDLLCKEYPDADCELVYKTPFQLLTSVIMSAQTTDVQVNKVTPKLFAKYPTAKALAPFVALTTAFVVAPLIAYATGGKYYIARKPKRSWQTAEAIKCCICEHAFEPEDMASCPAYGGPWPP